MGNGHSDGGAGGQRVDHVKIAAVSAYIGGTRTQTDVGIDFEDFGIGDKGNARGAAKFGLHEVLRGDVQRNARIL